jgi:hypothetical protein
VIYAKPPFAGPEAVLAYLSRYTHRVAISNSRLIAFDGTGVTFRYKDYRRTGADRQQVMTLAADEFIRRFLIHVLPRGFHRIRHYGLLAGSARKDCIAHARDLLAVFACLSIAKYMGRLARMSFSRVFASEPSWIRCSHARGNGLLGRYKPMTAKAPLAGAERRSVTARGRASIS